MNLPQTNSPTFEALRRITKARQILEEVVISSESFDYRKAKQGLIDLQRIIRELGREEARLRAGEVIGRRDRRAGGAISALGCRSATVSLTRSPSLSRLSLVQFSSAAYISAREHKLSAILCACCCSAFVTHLCCGRRQKVSV